MTSNSDKQIEHTTRFWNGRLSRQTFYVNGKQEGERKDWDINGHIRVREIYRNGILDGSCEYRHDNGQLWQQKFYRNGILEGEFKEWYQNGQIKFSTNYRGGNLDGIRRTWFDNGHISTLVFCRNGELHGEYRSWHRYGGGKCLSHEYYISGMIDSRFSFKKKRGFIRIKRLLQDCIHPIDTVLISDLAKLSGIK